MLTPRGGFGPVLFTQVQLVASSDGMFSRQDRLTLTAGRRAVRADQVVATSRAAAALDLHVGSRLPIGIWASSPAKGLPPFYRKLDLTVTGIGVVSTQVVQDDIDAERTGFLIGTPALDREFVPCCTATSYIGLRLAGGSRYSDAIATDYLRLASSGPSASGAQLLQLLEVYSTSAIEAQAQRAVRPEAIALGVFGIIALAAALIIGAQSLSRQLRAAADDADVLRALGAGPAAVAADGVLGLLGAVVAGALLAVAVAIGLSPFSLFGPVGRRTRAAGLPGLDRSHAGRPGADPHSRRRSRDHRLPPGAAPRPGARAVRPRFSRRPGRTRRGPGRAPGSAGLRFALEPGRGKTAVPVRSVLTGAVLAVVVIAATLTFGTSLRYLVSRPALYGWNFSYALYSTDGWGPFPPSRTTPWLHRDRLIAASTGVYFLTVQIDRQTVPAILSPARAAVGPRVLTGHAVDGPGQIVLGPATLPQLHKQVGDQVTVQLGPVIRDARLRIVGTAALPALGDTLGVHPSLSTGAVLPTTVVTPGRPERGRPGVRPQRDPGPPQARRQPGCRACGHSGRSPGPITRSCTLRRLWRRRARPRSSW